MSRCINDRDVTAKRPHKRRCGLCDGAILIGDRVRRYTYVGDGLTNNVEHRACADIASLACDGHDEFYNLDDDETRAEAMRLLAQGREGRGVVAPGGAA